MVIGVDFSLTSTGVCAITDGEAECITIRSSKEEAWWGFPGRVQEIGARIAQWVHPGPVNPWTDWESIDAWVIETPAFAAKGQLDRMFGGWWLLVDYLMAEEGWPAPLRVTPGQVKKYATGKGNASKRDVERAVWRRYPDVELSDDNQADALVLAAIGAGVERVPFEQHTQFQLEVIEKVKERR